MKKIFLVSVITLFFSACSFEQDTRLVCDHEEGNRGEILYNVPLVFNKSKNKLSWNGEEIDTSDKLTDIIYGDDKIKWNFTESKLMFRPIMFVLDRTNLEFIITDFTGSVGMFDVKQTLYKCKKVEGV